MSEGRPGAAALALVAAAALAFAGCASKRPAAIEHSEHMLADAGFRSVPADTPERVAALQRLQPETVTEVMRDGRTFYVFPDPKECHCLYVGTEDEYGEWQKLLYQSGHKQPAPVPWNEGELGNGAMGNWGVWGGWPWWD